MAPAERVLKIVGDMLIKLFVFLVFDFRAGAGPQRLSRVDAFQLRHKLFVFRRTVAGLGEHAHGHTDVVGVPSDNVT